MGNNLAVDTARRGRVTSSSRGTGDKCATPGIVNQAGEVFRDSGGGLTYM